MLHSYSLHILLLCYASCASREHASLGGCHQCAACGSSRWLCSPQLAASAAQQGVNPNVPGYGTISCTNYDGRPSEPCS